MFEELDFVWKQAVGLCYYQAVVSVDNSLIDTDESA